MEKVKARILVVGATAKELGLLIRMDEADPGKPVPIPSHSNADALLTGVGVLPTTFHLARVLMEQQYSLILNIGICGSYEAPPIPGEVVIVCEDRLYGLGAEGEDGFVNLRDIGLVKSGDPEDGFFITPEHIIPEGLKSLRKVKGITVNTIHSWDSSIRIALALTGARVESMEGAACMFAGAKYEIPVIQLRAISNMVGPRNRANWKINEALEALLPYVKSVLKEWK